jgi:hypothetical protein
MWLRLLVPLALLWPILSLTAEGTKLNRYRATPARELLALAVCIVAYFAIWILLDRVFEELIGSVAFGMAIATVVSLALVPGFLSLGFKIFAVRPGVAKNEPPA